MGSQSQGASRVSWALSAGVLLLPRALLSPPPGPELLDSGAAAVGLADAVGLGDVGPTAVEVGFGVGVGGTGVGVGGTAVGVGVGGVFVGVGVMPTVGVGVEGGGVELTGVEIDVGSGVGVVGLPPPAG
jgi:hypothetical protein